MDCIRCGPVEGGIAKYPDNRITGAVYTVRLRGDRHGEGYGSISEGTSGYKNHLAGAFFVP